jgi:hypothetical protein
MEKEGGDVTEKAIIPAVFFLVLSSQAEVS